MAEEIFGIDYSSNGELTSSGDLMLVDGLDNAKQAIRNRLLTRIMIYDYLGEYGCDLDKVIGEPTNHITLQFLNLIIKDSLNLEPRVQQILELDCYFEDKKIIGEMNLLLVDDTVIDINIETGIGGLL
jgi:phage baseplate assembly protein W